MVRVDVPAQQLILEVKMEGKGIDIFPAMEIEGAVDQQVERQYLRLLVLM